MIWFDKKHLILKFLTILNHKQRGFEIVYFFLLTSPPPGNHISPSFGSYCYFQTQQLAAYTYQCIKEENWAKRGGKVNLRRRKSENKEDSNGGDVTWWYLWCIFPISRSEQKAQLLGTSTPFPKGYILLMSVRWDECVLKYQYRWQPINSDTEQMVNFT